MIEKTNKMQQICCILLVFSIISQFAHDARSQKPKEII